MSLPRDELRFKVLELAVKTTSDLTEQMKRAEKFFDFVTEPQNVGESLKKAPANSQSGTPTILE